MLTVRSTINIAGQAVPNIIPAVQGDTGRSIEFTLADFTIPAGATANYYIQKPSGEAVYNAATINDNKVTVELTAQSLAETGDNYGQVRILNGEDVVTSFDFILLVKPFRGIEAIESTTEMNIFDEAVQNAIEQFDSMLPDIIAPEFDSSTAYAAGDYVIYGGKLYRFTAAHSGAWTGADAVECTVTEKLNEGGSGDGLTDDIKQALLQIAEKVAYIDDQGATYYQALYDSFYPLAELDSISAVYTQSGTVYDTDTLDSLKEDLVVTAHYSDQTTETVTDYTLSGTLAVGTSTVTVAYGGKTTTFNVTVTNVNVLKNGTHTFSSGAVGAKVTVTNNYRARLETPLTIGSHYVRLNDVSYNTANSTSSTNWTNNVTTLHTLTSGQTLQVQVKNFECYDQNGNTVTSITANNNMFAVAIKDTANNSIASISCDPKNGAVTLEDKERTVAITETKTIGAVVLFYANHDGYISDLSFDCIVLIDGVPVKCYV